MILLLGGTTEATSIARALVEAGFEVLLSTSTSISPRGLGGIRIRQRTGELDSQGLADLIQTLGIRIVVDATHPYASAISANAWTACQRTGTAYVAFDRPCAVSDAPDIHWASDHNHAATLACSFGQPVLLTIGVRNMAPYVASARLQGIILVARILDHPSSIEVCKRMGLDAKQLVCANGPFSVTDNALLIARHRIGTLVTKDSGDAGGVRNKIAAARNSGCRIVVVRRPPPPQAGHSSIFALLEAVRRCLPSRPFFLDSCKEIS